MITVMTHKLRAWDGNSGVAAHGTGAATLTATTPGKGPPRQRPPACPDSLLLPDRGPIV